MSNTPDKPATVTFTGVAVASHHYTIELRITTPTLSEMQPGELAAYAMGVMAAKAQSDLAGSPAWVVTDVESLAVEDDQDATPPSDPTLFDDPEPAA